MWDAKLYMSVDISTMVKIVVYAADSIQSKKNTHIAVTGVIQQVKTGLD